MGGPKKMAAKKRGTSTKKSADEKLGDLALKLTAEKKTLQNRLDDLIAVNSEQLNRLVNHSTGNTVGVF